MQTKRNLGTSSHGQFSSHKDPKINYQRSCPFQLLESPHISLQAGPQASKAYKPAKSAHVVCGWFQRMVKSTHSSPKTNGGIKPQTFSAFLQTNQDLAPPSYSSPSQSEQLSNGLGHQDLDILAKEAGAMCYWHSKVHWGRSHGAHHRPSQGFNETMGPWGVNSGAVLVRHFRSTRCHETHLHETRLRSLRLGFPSTNSAANHSPSKIIPSCSMTYHERGAGCHCFHLPHCLQ